MCNVWVSHDYKIVFKTLKVVCFFVVFDPERLWTTIIKVVKVVPVHTCSISVKLCLTSTFISRISLTRSILEKQKTQWRRSYRNHPAFTQFSQFEAETYPYYRKKYYRPSCAIAPGSIVVMNSVNYKVSYFHGGLLTMVLLSFTFCYS